MASRLGPEAYWARMRRLSVAWVALAVVTCVVEVLFTVWPGPVLRALAITSVVVLTVAGGALAVFAEGGFDAKLRGQGAATRLLRGAAVAVAVCSAAALIAFLLRSLTVVLWLDSLVPWAVVAIGWAYFQAVVGTALVLAVDSLLERLRPTLKIKILALVTGLGVVALALNLTFSGLVEFLQTVVEWAPGTKLKLGGLSSEISGEEVLAFFSGHPFRVALVVHSMAFVLILPATASALFKFASSVVDALRPLSKGFARLSAGERDFSITEAGPRDLAALNQQFNQAVQDLKLAEKMERAFGTYVSTSVLERIRSQHGEASIPAAMREASVFFADVRGFTAMSERLTPAQVLSLLNRYYQHVVRIVKAHDGFLDKFIGDAVVVVFNVPVDQPDHAERAVACAIDIQKAISTLNADGAFPEIGTLEVGIGIASGPMIAGNVGSEEQMEYTVIGDTVNLAARFCGHAPAGEVWVNTRCAGELDAGGLALAPIAVKGKQEKVTPHRVWPVA